MYVHTLYDNIDILRRTNTTRFHLSLIPFDTTESSNRLGVTWVVRPLLGLVLGLLVSITTGGFALFALLKCNNKQQTQQKHTTHQDDNKGRRNNVLSTW